MAAVRANQTKHCDDMQADLEGPRAVILVACHGSQSLPGSVRHDAAADASAGLGLATVASGKCRTGWTRSLATRCAGEWAPAPTTAGEILVASLCRVRH